MKAIQYTTYGGPEVLQLVEVATPEPQPDEVQIAVQAAALNAADWRLMRSDPFFVRFSNGLLRPKNPWLGSDMAGIVTAVGSQVTRFKIGDAVLGDLSGIRLGALAETVCAPEALLAHKPEGVSFAEAAALPMAAVTALQGLRDVGGIQAGERVLINGASGGVGSFALQLAKYFGAEVSAVVSTRKADAARQLGADHVIDYTQTDFTHSGEQYDLIFAANGAQSLRAYARALTPTGRLVVAGGSLRQILSVNLLGPLLSRKGGKQLRGYVAVPKAEDLQFVADLVAAGSLQVIIDQTYPLAETAQALADLEAGRAAGKLTLSVASEPINQYTNRPIHQ